MEVDSIILRHIGLYPTRDLAELALSKALGAVPVNEIVHPPDGTYVLYHYYTLIDMLFKSYIHQMVRAVRLFNLTLI